MLAMAGKGMRTEKERLFRTGGHVPHERGHADGQLCMRGGGGAVPVGGGNVFSLGADLREALMHGSELLLLFYWWWG